MRFSSMARMHVKIDDKLETRFRKTIAKRLGLKKGNITIAVSEAIRDWIKKKPKAKKQ